MKKLAMKESRRKDEKTKRQKTKQASNFITSQNVTHRQTDKRINGHGRTANRGGEKRTATSTTATNYLLIIHDRGLGGRRQGDHRTHLATGLQGLDDIVGDAYGTGTVAHMPHAPVADGQVSQRLAC